MAKQVTVNEIENLIKEKLKSSGTKISDDIVSKIKQNILEKYNQEKQDSEPVNVDISSEPTQTEEDVPNPESVQQDASMDNNKEEELSRKEEELRRKEEELNRKEEELKYKPQLPTPLKEIGKEEFFVFDENQISLGGEALSNAQLYLKNNPEIKSSMMESWLNKGMSKADLFIVEFKKIGELEFNPFEGTTNLMKFTEPMNVNNQPVGFPVETNTVSDTEKIPGDDFFDEIIKEKINKFLLDKLK